MYKRVLIILLCLSFLAAACSAASSQSAPDYAYTGGDGAYVAESEAAYEESTRDFDDSGVSSQPQVAEQERLVIKNADMSISVDEPLSTMEAMLLMAEEMGGFVVSSNLYYTTLESGLEVPRANVTIRIPAERLNEAIERIESGAGRVLSKNVSGEDVTQDYTDLKSRLRNLEEAEAQLQNIMDGAKDTEDVLNVYNQLVYIREQIEVIKGRITYYEQSAAFSSINLDILADAAVQPLTIGGWEPVGVAKQAVQALINTLKGLANAAIWLTLYVLPVLVVLSIPLWLLWFGFRRWRARRRNVSARVGKPNQE